MKNKNILTLLALIAVTGLMVDQAVLANGPVGAPPANNLPDAEFNSVKGGFGGALPDIGGSFQGKNSGADFTTTNGNAIEAWAVGTGNGLKSHTNNINGVGVFGYNEALNGGVGIYGKSFGTGVGVTGEALRIGGIGLSGVGETGVNADGFKLGLSVKTTGASEGDLAIKAFSPTGTAGKFTAGVAGPGFKSVALANTGSGNSLEVIGKTVLGGDTVVSGKLTATTGIGGIYKQLGTPTSIGPSGYQGASVSCLNGIERVLSCGFTTSANSLTQADQYLFPNSCQIYVKNSSALNPLPQLTFTPYIMCFAPNGNW